MTAEPGAGRLFVGIALSDEVRSGIEAVLDSSDLPRLPGRCVAPGSWHLTLRFLGDTSKARLVALERELSALERASPFDLELGGWGAFPRPARASVLWLGTGAGAAALGSLAASAEAAATRAGFAPDPRPFRGHLTLSRIRPPADVRTVLSALPHCRWHLAVREVTLFRSHLGAAGARYEPLRRVRLASDGR
jgi:RNA 2',3'-cyclic 3'-phosphodiesterase